MKKLRIGDIVYIKSGKSKGQQGRLASFAKNGNYVIVEGVNLVTKFVKKGMLGKGQAGQLIKKESPIHVSNVMVVCPACGKPTKIEISITKEGKKFRKCKKCGALIDTIKSVADNNNKDKEGKKVKSQKSSKI